MWDDNEAESDFLNFTGVAGTVAEIIIQADGRPISIGVSGAWGVGKTSLMRLTQRELEARPAPAGQRTFVFVSFNRVMKKRVARLSQPGAERFFSSNGRSDA